MADLDNIILDGLDQDDAGSFIGDDDQQQLHGERTGGDDHGINAERSEPSSVPAALAAAAAERRRRQQQQEDNDVVDRRGAYEDDAADDAVFGDEDEGGDYNEDEDDGRGYNPDYEQLKALWTSELACPDLLPHDAENAAWAAGEISTQEDVVDELLRRSKEQQQRQSSREGGATSGELASLVAQVTKMDLDRTRFMLVDLARTRMAKIENHALHNRTLLDRMTEEEASYLRQYGELLEKHFRRTVLNHLPKEAWKKLDEPEMIDAPDLEQFVFCRVLETVQIDVAGEPNPLDDDLANDDDQDDFGDNVQEHQAGSCLIVMYKKVMDLVLEGKVELLM